ncbi:MAG: hypothetical protein LBM02_06120 [Lachnospiraceae bacterium]|jgi:hypothetical protein|nr:hypothetical protein [Lachnospiraceae bacterium]
MKKIKQTYFVLAFLSFILSYLINDYLLCIIGIGLITIGIVQNISIKNTIFKIILSMISYLLLVLFSISWPFPYTWMFLIGSGFLIVVFNYMFLKMGE